MTSPPSSQSDARHRAAVQEAADRLTALGWTVETERELDVPGMGKYRADYVARNGDKVIVGEVKYRGETSTTALEQLSRSVDMIPNASLEMIWLGEAPGEIDAAGITQMADVSRRILSIDRAAAMLAAWAALEGALEVDDRRDGRTSDKPRFRNARQRLNERANLGELSEGQLKRLMLASKIRNSVAHGIRSEPDRDLVEYVATIAVAIATETFVPIESMSEWFLRNFKDPADGVPFDGRDGGYQYVNGGPYDARDEISEQFSSMPWQDVEDAAAMANRDGGPDWVREDEY